MYVERVPNRNSPPAVLLRESYRDGSKIKKRTLANLADWPAAKVEALRRVLRDEPVATIGQDGLSILRSLPHGHVAAALGKLHKLGLDRLLSQGGRQSCREVALCTAMIVARLIDPASKLATARGLDDDTASTSLGQVLDLGEVDERELYATLDWLVGQQARIEKSLARRHLHDGTLVLYDVTSSYFEGRTCPLAKRGYNRDRKRGKLQIVIGLLCTAEGCPIAVEVFEGNVGDPSTVAAQVDKLKQQFGLNRVVLVGDRGMLTQARIEETVKPAGLNFITSLRAPAIQSLVQTGALQPSLFDERDLAEITSPDFPGERLVACRNPLLTDERTRKRNALLDATEKDLLKLQERVRRTKRALRGKDKIALKVGARIDKYKMAKHFDITITDTDLSFTRKADQIDEEALLDGIYVVRTDVTAKRSTHPWSSRLTKTLRMSSAPSDASKPSISKCAPSTIVSPTAYGLTCCFACSLTISNGTCARTSGRSFSKTMTRLQHALPAPRSLPRQNVPRPPIRRLQPNVPTTACLSTASGWPPSPETPWL